MMTMGHIIGGGFRLVRERIGSIAVWALVYLVLNVVVFFAMRPFMANIMVLQAQQAAGAAPDPAALLRGAGAIFGVSLLLLLGILVLYTAALRSAVRPADNAFAYLRLGMDELRLLGLAVILVIAFVLLYIASVLVAGVIAAAIGIIAHDVIIPVAIALVLAVLATLVYFQVRFSLVFALTMRRRKIVVGESWTITKGHFWTLFGAYFVLLLIVFASATLLFTITAGPYLFNLGRAAADPAAIKALQHDQLARQYGPVTVTTMLGWVLGAVLGAFWITLGAGAAGAATGGLINDAFADIGAVYE